MNSRWLISLVVWLLVAVTGCGGAHRYDGRLVMADSLMQHSPDSALALVEAVSPDSLADGGDRAYRDLLLTQARYKCYITATSDSDINRALNYYRQHDDEREKLTRAYIYKGAVMEELGHPDSAMLYYKTAEATADTSDYFNLGYIKIRMATLYDMYYDLDGKSILKYEEALDYFTKSNNTEYQYLCLNNLGCLYRDSKPLKAEQLIKEALAISKKSNNKKRIIEGYHALIILYFYQHHNDKALKLVREAAKLNWNDLSFDYCTTAANVYSRAGLLDSAMLYLNKAKSLYNPDVAEHKMYLLESLSEIALSKCDTANYLNLSVQWKHISDSLITNSQKMDITESEEKMNQNTLTAMNHESSSSRQLAAFIIIAAIFSIAIIYFIYYRKSWNYRLLLHRLKKDADEQISVLKTLQQKTDYLKIKDQQTKDFINSQLQVLQEITMACYVEQDTNLGKKIKMIVQLQNEDKHKWTQLYAYIDSEYNNIIAKTQKSYPQLNDKDLLLLALNCLGFSYIQIAMIMGYSNATSIGTIKNRLAKKMNLNCSLNDYISQYTSIAEPSK